MTLGAVLDAIKGLQINAPNEYEVSEQRYSCRNEIHTYFVAEDSFVSTDVKVTVEGIGELSYPLEEETIKQLISISSKATFGSDSGTMFDLSVRDTYMIPASKLEVVIKEQALTNVLTRIRSGLNINLNCTLVPHLHNMLIYDRGQFFKQHRDTEKVDNMVATFVVILPSLYEGGNLVITHEGVARGVLGSKDLGVIKCVAFYSDCQHSIQEVKSGVRVALTYNLELQSPPFLAKDIDLTAVDKHLDIGLTNYFATGKQPKKLVYMLNHWYSRHGIKWHLLKGEDRTYAHALFAVAKKQGLIPCLALAKCEEHWDTQTSPRKLIKSTTQLIYFIDEQNVNVQSLPNLNLGPVSDNEICCIKENVKIKPYKSMKIWYGNEYEDEERWYQRGCVVLSKA